MRLGAMVRPWSVGTLIASWIFIGSCSSDPRPEASAARFEAAPVEPELLVPAPLPQPPVLEADADEVARAQSEGPSMAPSEPSQAPAEPTADLALPRPEATAEPDSPPQLAPEPEVVEEPPAEPLPPTPVPELIAAHREVFVYAEPSRKRKLGYLRAGARVARSATAVSVEGCPAGVYRVAPEGFVCADESVRLERADAVGDLLARRPDRLAPLPYVYAQARHDTPPLYTKLPSGAEQREAEGNPRKGSARAFNGLTVSPTPSWLDGDRHTPTLWGQRRASSQSVTGNALLGSSFALLEIFERDARQFGLRSDLTLVPLDRVQRVNASNFHGVSLEDVTLPVAFVMSRAASLYDGSKGGGLSVSRSLLFREALPLSGKEQLIHGSRYLETSDGRWLRDERLVRVERPSALPKWATSGKRWIHVSIASQTLVAYEGERPAYVTLVSTGADGLGDPATTRSTVLGQFLVHTKHVTAAMTSDEEGDQYELLDVPWVQYFSENYAFHAAYWHDEFGAPRSHGCVNLSPRDARFLFHWTDPAVPQAWHGAFSLLGGTPVQITP